MRGTTGLLTLIVAGSVLAGCSSAATGGSTTTTGSAAASGSSSPEQALTKAEQDSVKIENLIADCMKAQGFTYVAHPTKYDNPADDAGMAGRGDPSQVPFDALKSYREKYGFAIYGRDVFPTDPNVGNKPEEPNPNNAIRAALDSAQQEAYDKALLGQTMGELTKAKADSQAGKPYVPGNGGCSEKASNEVNPPEPDKQPDPAKDAAYAQLMQDFYTDPKLLEASQAYGACLRQQGFQVDSTKPGTIESTVQQIILKERSALPEKIDSAVAQQGLRKEITASLTDLDCGKDYLALAKPFMEKILNSEGGTG
jgi:hypothetical protein